MMEENQQIDRMTPLEFLEEVYTCNELPLQTRMRAATAAAPYCHPKLAATAILTPGDMGDRLEQARKRVAGLEAARARGFEALVEFVRGPKVIEAKPIEKGPAEQASPSLVPLRRL